MLRGVNKNQHEMSTGDYEKAHVYTKTLKKNKKTRQIRHQDRLLSNNEQVRFKLITANVLFTPSALNKHNRRADGLEKKKKKISES